MCHGTHVHGKRVLNAFQAPRTSRRKLIRGASCREVCVMGRTCTENTFSMLFRPHSPEGEVDSRRFVQGNVSWDACARKTRSQCFSGLALQKEKVVSRRFVQGNASRGACARNMRSQCFSGPTLPKERVDSRRFGQGSVSWDACARKTRLNAFQVSRSRRRKGFGF